IWREDGEAHELTLGRIEKRLAEVGAPVRRDDGYHEWDLEVDGGALGAARLRSCAEWHGGARQLVRFAVHPRLSRIAQVLAGFATVVSAWALSDGAVAAAALLGSVAALVLTRALRECGISVAVLTDAVRSSEAQRAGSSAFADAPLAATSDTQKDRKS